MKKLIILFLCAVLTVSVSYAETENVVINAIINIKDMGEIKLELYPDIAPQSVSNFVELAKSDFYKGLIFHRVIDGFMIQGGDPLGSGYGGPDYSIYGEFKSNGFENKLSHTRGTISFARSYDPNSAGSQFFIVQSDSTFLDGDYAAFGIVTDGMDIVDKIAKMETDKNNKPLQDVIIENITIDGDYELAELNKYEK